MNSVQAIFELDDEFNPPLAMEETLEFPQKPPAQQPTTERPIRPRLDTIMSATSVGSGHPPSGESPRRGGFGDSPRGTPPDRRPVRASPDEQTPTGHRSGGMNHNSAGGTPQNGGHALHQYQQHQQHHHQRQQHHGPSGITTQLTSPIGRRQRRKSTFEPRLLPYTDTSAAAATPGAYMSPLAQLFTPIVTEPPNGGFNALMGDHTQAQTHLGQRRASRRSGGDAQVAPGVAMFRRRVLSGMPGHGQSHSQSGIGMGTSALSTTPKEDESKEPSETVSLHGFSRAQGVLIGVLGR